MNKSENINEIALALSKFQGEALNPTKDKKGYNYTYADLASLLDVTRPLLEKNGLAVAQIPFNADGLVGVETILTHLSGQWLSGQIAVPVESAQKMSIAQASGSVITYLRRYSYASILGIAQDDNDAATQFQKKENTKSQLSGKPTNEQLERLMAVTSEENKQNAKEWFNSQTKKGVEDYLLTQEQNNAA